MKSILISLIIIIVKYREMKYKLYYINEFQILSKVSKVVVWMKNRSKK